MDLQMALNEGKAIGELMVIDWKDQNEGWTEFMRLKDKINISKPFRRIVKLVSKDGEETITVLKYEKLSDFCYLCGLIGHTFQKCHNKREGDMVDGLNLQYGAWMRTPFVTPNEDREEIQTNTKDDSGQPNQKEKEKGVEEDLISNSPIEKKSHKLAMDSMGRFKHKRKRMRE
ncbi:hypothetical protein PVK06_005560 [Gossypium arboreum]|uniref:Zinc knuckle CX2CX4HX4C domain-containing protein n=1 Tax=Gossypium arboreum TaxID=29729 RepID=A0ABR0QUW5_GOSAR|nr:hypothetical protein PVK06_005560 [Gossypium arboreum]